jgi:hypothetical protein
MLISQVPLINMRRFAFYSKHAKYPSNIDYHKPWLQGSHSSYSYHHKVMKLIILRLGAANKPSLISVSVHCKGTNLTTWHKQARRAPRVPTVHDAVKESSRVLPHPIAVFHTYASTDTPWVARTLPHYTSVKWGRVSSNSAACEATQFRDSICPLRVTTFQMLVHSDPTNLGLNRHRRGLPPWRSKFQIRPLILLPI